MRHTYLKIGMGMAMGLALSACDLTQVTKANNDTKQPATEATVIGTWRTDIPVSQAPPIVMKMTMVINANHTLLTSQRLPTGEAAPYDNIETAHENWTWSVADGKLSSQKTTCEYRDPKNPTADPTTECQPPLTRDAAINVNGSAWTIVDPQAGPLVFKKD